MLSSQKRRKKRTMKCSNQHMYYTLIVTNAQNKLYSEIIFLVSVYTEKKVVVFVLFFVHPNSTCPVRSTASLKYVPLFLLKTIKIYQILQKRHWLVFILQCTLLSIFLYSFLSFLLLYSHKQDTTFRSISLNVSCFLLLLLLNQRFSLIGAGWNFCLKQRDIKLADKLWQEEHRCQPGHLWGPLKWGHTVMVIWGENICSSGTWLHKLAGLLGF